MTTDTTEAVETLLEVRDVLSSIHDRRRGDPCRATLALAPVEMAVLRDACRRLDDAITKLRSQP